MNDINLEDIANRNWLTRDEAIAYIGKNSEYYLEKWGRHQKSFYKGWNWAAALFRIEWMAYRKMYVEAVLVLIAVMVLGIAIDGLLRFLNIRLPEGLFTLAIQVLIGFFANGLYRMKALRTLQKTRHMDAPQRLSYLSKKGGTSLVGLFVFLCMQIIAFAIIPMVVIPMIIR